MKKHWIDDLRNRLGHYETEAPEGVWSSISERLYGAAAPMDGHLNVAPKQRKQAATIWLIPTGIAATIALLALLSYPFLHHEEPIRPTLPTLAQEVPAAQQQIMEQEAIEHPTSPLNNSSEQSTSSAESQAGAFTSASGKQAVGSTSPIEEKASAPTSTTEKQVVNPSSAFSDNPEQPSSSAGDKVTSPSPHSPSRRWGETTIATTPRGARRHARWSLSASASGGIGSNSNLHSREGVLMVSAPSSYHTTWADSPLLGIGLMNRGEEVHSEYKHHLPLRFGLNVAFYLSPRLAVESGLSYTRLTSDHTEGSYHSYHTTTQKIDYLGIPLKLKYQFLSLNRIALYASAGAMAEQCISGKATTQYVIQQKAQQTEKQNLTSRPLQLSAQAALGVEYHFIDRFSLFAEPGVGYYFDDRSSLETIYQKRPFNFNLNLGIRFKPGKR